MPLLFKTLDAWYLETWKLLLSGRSGTNSSAWEGTCSIRILFHWRIQISRLWASKSFFCSIKEDVEVSSRNIHHLRGA
jgi:hypothetical protein